MDALLATLRIISNSWKIFGQVQGIEPLSYVLSFWYSLCALENFHNWNQILEFVKMQSFM